MYAINRSWMDEASHYEGELCTKSKAPKWCVCVCVIATATFKEKIAMVPSKIPPSGKGSIKGVCLAHGVGVLGYVKERKYLRAMVTTPFRRQPFRISQSKVVMHLVDQRHIDSPGINQRSPVKTEKFELFHIMENVGKRMLLGGVSHILLMVIA